MPSEQPMSKPKASSKVPSQVPPSSLPTSGKASSQPPAYPVAARYENEPVFLQDDKEPGPRGMALRIFSAQGERLPGNGNEALTNQDFFFNNAPMIELTDLPTCLEIMQLREKNFDSPTGLSLAMKTRTDAMRSSMCQACCPTRI